MDPAQVGILGLVVLILMLFTGMPIGAVMAVVGFCGFAYLRGIDPALGLLRTVPYSTAASYTMSVMPMFVIMGEFAFHSGISKDLYSAAHKWFGRIPGGLAMGTIWAGASFGAMCGSAAASTATFGSVALPEMKKYRYNMGFSAATISAAGTLAIMIPPSTIFIIYGVLTEQSIGKLFVAGIVPGILLASLYCLTIYILTRRDPTLAPGGTSYSLREKFAALKGSWPMLILFMFVMGGIWTGVFTATEAGALGASGSLLFLIWRGEFNRKNVVASLTATVNIVGLAMLILFGAYILGYFMAVTNLPLAIANWLKAAQVPPLAVPFGIIVLYFFLGWAMDELTMVVLTTPLFFPVLKSLGFDPIWWGVMVCISIQQGQLSPPVGLNLNIICGLTKGEVPMIEIFKNVIPYVVCLMFFMVVIFIFPDIALWLPRMMK